jgi:hypothetical protein
MSEGVFGVVRANQGPYASTLGLGKAERDLRMPRQVYPVADVLNQEEAIQNIDSVTLW